MTKYERLLNDLQTKGTGQMRVFGNSMTPLIKSGAMLYYEAHDKYEVGDVVFCKVRGRWIDAHKIIKVMGDSYLIANNHGHENGWTRRVYGKVTAYSR